MRAWRHLSVFCFALMVTVAGALERPDPEGTPTTVHVTALVLDIDEVNSAEQNFVANLYISLRWHDERLVSGDKHHRVLALDEVWQPRLIFVNQQKIWPSLPREVRVSPEGDVVYKQRVWGPFSQPLDVHDFPMDSQDFEMRLASTTYGPDELKFVKDAKSTSGLAPEFSLPDWDVTGWEFKFDVYNPLSSEHGAASFAMVLHGTRHAKHYLLKVLLPLVMIVAMSWVVFWIDPKQSGTQIGVATTSMLTLIAFRFAVAGGLPPVPYLTRMDSFILGSTFLVFASLVESVITGTIATRGHVRAARVVDWVCRLIFPAAFVVLAMLTLFKDMI